MVNHLTKLAYFHLHNDEIQKAAYYSGRAVELLHIAEENGKANETDWAATAFVYAKVQSYLNNFETAKTWFDKAINAYTIQGDWGATAKTQIDLAKELLTQQENSSAIDIAGKAKNNALIAGEFRLAIEANTIIAETLRDQGDYRKYVELTKESINIAKSMEFNALEQNLTKRLDFSGETASGQDKPILRIIEEIFYLKLEWKETESVKCPICRREISTEQAEIRCVHCGTDYHLDCWDNIDHNCPICNKQ
jgi:tetratricopeptide (TPR) repeat protein